MPRIAAVMFSEISDLPILAQHDESRTFQLLKKSRELLQEVSSRYRGRFMRGTEEGESAKATGLKDWMMAGRTATPMKPRESLQTMATYQFVVEFDNSMAAIECAADFQKNPKRTQSWCTR